MSDCENEKAELAIREFCEAAIEKGDFATPARLDHKLHARMASSIKELRKLGAAGNNALESLLTHDSPHVRRWVAAELLSTGNKKAIPVLEELCLNGGLIGMGAEIVLKEYKAKRLRSPFGINKA